jgi:transcriptional regulator PpsR
MMPFADPKATLGHLDAKAVGRLMAAAADVTLIVDAGGVIRDISLGGNELAGLGCESWVGRLWSEIVTADSRPKVDALLRDADADRRWRQVNHASKQGPDLPMLYSTVRMGREGGSPAEGYSIAFGRDLRATAALQQRLVEAQQSMEREYWKFRHAETRYRHLFQVAGEAVMVVDTATQKVLEANPAAQVLIGDGRGSPVGATLMSAFADASAEAVQALLAGVRANGRADQVRVELNDARGEVTLYASMFRQDGSSHFLARIARTQAADTPEVVPSASAMVLKLVQQAPDCLVLTDLEGRILSANAAFVELVQMSGEEQVRGESLDRWLGRTGVDLSVLLSNLRQRESVRLFATTLRGELGSSTDVEISATMVPFEDQPFLGFNIRDVGRRLTGEARQTRELPRSVSQLTELVGRVPLKDIVGETTDLIEQLCIEAALDLTRDNRASAAEMLGLSRQSLYVKLRRYGLGDLGVETAK